MENHIDPLALKAIASLQRPGKPDLVNRIVELFKSESPKSIAALQQGLDLADLKLVRDAAHTLKSSSAYVGAGLLCERCRDLESAARQENLLECIVLGDSVLELFDASLAELTLRVSTPF